MARSPARSGISTLARDRRREASMSGALAGKTALVTGGGTGIGFGCARALLLEGASVTIVGRRAELLEEGAQKLGAEVPDGDIRWKTCDVTREEDVAAAVAHAADPRGHLDVAVANAGTG